MVRFSVGNVGAAPIQVFDADDRAARVAAMAMLARVVAAKVELAQAFGVHRNTVARLTDRLEQGGLAAVVPAKPGPKGPHKVTGEVWRVILENSGLGVRRLSPAVGEQTGVQLTRSASSSSASSMPRDRWGSRCQRRLRWQQRASTRVSPQRLLPRSSMHRQRRSCQPQSPSQRWCCQKRAVGAT